MNYQSAVTFKCTCEQNLNENNCSFFLLRLFLCKLLSSSYLAIWEPKKLRLDFSIFSKVLSLFFPYP